MATVVQQRWLEGSLNSDGTPESAAPSLSVTLAAAPTAGNLLVMYAVGRTSSTAPTIGFVGGSSETVDTVLTVAPMEFHTFAIGWRIVQSGDSSTWTANYSPDAHSKKIGVVEYDLASATVDASSFDGTGASNASSIATGSTGALSSADGLWFSAGTSRTANASLSNSLGGTVLFSNAADTDPAATGNPSDHGQANSSAAWANLADTSALDDTWTEANGSSRMGAAIVVFVEDAGGAVEINPIGAVVATVTGTADVTGEADITPTGAVVTTVEGFAAIDAEADIVPTGAVVQAVEGTADISTTVEINPTGAAVETVVGTADITGEADIDPVGAIVVTVEGTANIIDPGATSINVTLDVLTPVFAHSVDDAKFADRTAQASTRTRETDAVFAHGQPGAPTF